MSDWPEPTACCPFGDCDTCNPTHQHTQEAHNRTQTALQHAALADIAQAAHNLSQAICDWLDLKEHQ